jgi:hypothetical protein
MSLLPNLFVIGAMKSGTTSLFHCLNEHDEISTSPLKEPRFFSHNRNYNKGYDYYLQNFSKAVDEKYLCEASTDYTKRPGRDGVAQRIHKFNPNARFIYIMRDPFKRIISQYLHQLKMEAEWRGIIDAIENKGEYLSNSNYSYQIKPYLDIFGEKAVYMCTLEDMVETPNIFYQKLFEWLQIESEFVPKSARIKYNSSSRIVTIVKEKNFKTKMVKYFQHMLSKTFLRNNYYADILPALLLRQKYVDINSPNFYEEVEAARSKYRPILKNWVNDLSMLTNKNYGNWL